MHMTLHLTEGCNLACRYCYVKQHPGSMSLETAKAAVRLAAASSIAADKNSSSRTGGLASCGIIFFGGEPLLCRDLIEEIVCFCRALEKEEPVCFHFKMTTNGTLLTEDFLEFSKKERIMIALSHDGTKRAHDLLRCSHNGQGTYEALETRISLLLKAHPYAPVMITVNPETVWDYADGVRELWQKGFRYFICSLNYAGIWKDFQLRELKKQYQRLADFYYELTKAEQKFYLSPFEVKITSHIKGDAFCSERCELGKKQVSVAPDGTIFPCTQFVGQEDYSIGNVFTGINSEKRLKLYYDNELDKPECSGCVLTKRCHCHCGCLNYQVTGSIHHVPPVLCEHERILFPIADKLAERLFRERNEMFIQKHYNDIFPLISYIEDYKR